MLIKESEYLRKLLLEIQGNNLKIINFGSQSTNFLKNQPHIIKNIIKPSVERGHSITNLDIKQGEGVDIMGDIFDNDFFLKLKSEQFDVVFVFNLLEHVTNVELMISRIQDLVSKDMFIVFSGPFKYPIHYDPIDNGLRPNISDVTKLFSDCEFVNGEIIKDYTYSKYLFKSPKLFIINIIRTLAFFYKFNKWRKVVIPKYKWLFRKYETTCVLLKKIK